MKKKIRKAVFPVAGLGTRFLPATKVLPKEMLPVFNKPIVQYAVEEAMEAGVEEFIFVTGRGKVIIEDHFDISYELEQHLENNNKQSYKDLIVEGIPKPGKAFFTRQQYPMGLGHAVWCAKALINDEPFAVLLPDELLKSQESCLASMVNLYNNSDAEMILATTEVPWDRVSSYGIISLKETGGSNQGNEDLMLVKDVVEKPAPDKAPSNLAIIGRYILQPDIFEYLEKAHRGVGGEIQLTDSIEQVLENKKTYGYLYKGDRYDCGNPVGLLEASLDIALGNKMFADTVQNIINNRASKS